MSHTRPRWYRTRAALAVAALLALTAAGTTFAALTDRATLTLGGGDGVGNPTRFSIQVQDGNGDWQDAADASSAVELPFTGAESPVAVGIDTEVVLAANFRIVPDAPAGFAVPTLAPLQSGCNAQCAALFEYLRFTVAYDNEPAFATDLTATELNALDSRKIVGLLPGIQHTITISASLDASFALDPDLGSFATETSGVTIQFNAESSAP